MKWWDREPTVTERTLLLMRYLKGMPELSPTLFDLRRVERRMFWKEKIMEASTRHLVLAPDAAIDLQLHTTFSDGTWTPEQLIDSLVREQFGLVAITDHDRVDTAAALQQLAAEKQLGRGGNEYLVER